MNKMYSYSTFPFKLITTCLLWQWGIHEKTNVCCLNQASHMANPLCWLLMNVYLHTLIQSGQWWQLEELFFFVGWTHNIVLVMCSKPAKSPPPREEIFCTGGFTSVSCFLVSRQNLHSSCWAPPFGCLTLRQYLLLDHLCRPHLRCPLGWGESS